MSIFALKTLHLKRIRLLFYFFGRGKAYFMGTKARCTKVNLNMENEQVSESKLIGVMSSMLLKFMSDNG